MSGGYNSVFMMFVFAARVTEGSVAVDCQITSSLGRLHCSLRQQLGLLHAADLPPAIPQEHPPLRHEECKFAKRGSNSVFSVFICVPLCYVGIVSLML